MNSEMIGVQNVNQG